MRDAALQRVEQELDGAELDLEQPLPAEEARRADGRGVADAPAPRG